MKTNDFTIYELLAIKSLIDRHKQFFINEVERKQYQDEGYIEFCKGRIKYYDEIIRKIKAQMKGRK